MPLNTMHIHSLHRLHCISLCGPPPTNKSQPSCCLTTCCTPQGTARASHGLLPGAKLGTSLGGGIFLRVEWESDDLYFLDTADRAAGVKEADIGAGRAVAHIVDAVLLPAHTEGMKARGQARRRGRKVV